MKLSSLAVVTPSYNQGRFIERTIQSVLSQDVSPLEYLVRDGGSTDETVAILRRYADRLRFVSEPDRGQSHAVNMGVAQTRGEIICWLNSDDVYPPGALATVQRLFAAHPEVDALYGDADFIDEAGAVLGPYYTEDWNYQRLQDVCFLCQPAVFFRRRLVERLGGLDESLQYCMDYELWFRYGRHVPFLRVPHVLAQSRIYPDTKTYGARVKVHREINHMFRKTFGRVPDQWILGFALHWCASSRWRRHFARPQAWPWRQLFYTVATLSHLRWNGRLTPDNVRAVERHLYTQTHHPQALEDDVAAAGGNW